jgi:hypothetical protein
MPTDAKCGLLVGVGLVLAVAVLYFQEDPAAPESPIPPASPAAAVKPPEATRLPDPPSALAPGRPVSRTNEDLIQSRSP